LSLKVVAKVFQKTKEGIAVPMVESQTVVGNKQHQRGLVEARNREGKYSSEEWNCSFDRQTSSHHDIYTGTDGGCVTTGEISLNVQCL
jgi:hypothetical protein